MASSVPDAIYALASIAGDEGCSRWCAQEAYVKEQSYSTAEAANAAAEKELLGPHVPELGFDGKPIEGEPAERYFERDYRGDNKTGYILEYATTISCYVLLLETRVVTDAGCCLLQSKQPHVRSARPSLLGSSTLRFNLC